MRNRVKTIRAHSPIFADGYGSNTDTFPSSKGFPGLVMLRTTDGVEVTSDNKKSFLVPWGNIKSVDLFENEYAPPAANKVSQAV